MKFHSWLCGLLGIGLMFAGIPEIKGFAVICGIMIIVIIWATWHDNNHTK